LKIFFSQILFKNEEEARKCKAVAHELGKDWNWDLVWRNTESDFMIWLVTVILLADRLKQYQYLSSSLEMDRGGCQQACLSFWRY
jgi:hypothetical protein